MQQLTPASFRTARPAKRSNARTMLEEVLEGLKAPRKRLPCKYFYDAEGSRLFDAICDLDEYYPTRTEHAIMRRHATEMARAIGPACRLVELGSGSSWKTRVLLDHLEHQAEYIPVDISREHLFATAAKLSRLYPEIPVRPVCADFTDRVRLPRPLRPAESTVVYFPGSTIGNFTPADAVPLLAAMAELAGPGGGLLIGVDLKKSRSVLEAAYNDSNGVTAEFNLNLLARLNRELGADFNLEEFAHRAVYNEALGRIEMHLDSLRRQTVRVGSAEIDFAAGESIHTENSYKYTLEEFEDVARKAGFQPECAWLDERQYFSVQYFRCL